MEQLLPNENREQIVVGTLDGLLTVLDPGRSSAENREQMSSLAEISLDRPILQVIINYRGNLPKISSFDLNILSTGLNGSISPIKFW